MKYEPPIEMRCSLYPEDIIRIEDNEHIVVEVESPDSKYIWGAALSPEDAAAFAAHLMHLAIKKGALTPDVLFSYGNAMCSDAAEIAAKQPPQLG